MPLLMLLLQAVHMHEHGSAPPDPMSLHDHHLAGLLLVLLGIIAYLEQTKLSRYAGIKYLWPMPLLGLGIFLFFFRDRKEPWLDWMLQGLWEKTEVQHKLFESVALAVGLIELFRRTGWLTHPAWRQVLNVLMLCGAIFLLFHTGQHSMAIHLQHKLMGSVAIALSLSKIVADLGWGGKWLGLYAVPGLMTLFGLQFVLYCEACPSWLG